MVWVGHTTHTAKHVEGDKEYRTGNCGSRSGTSNTLTLGVNGKANVTEWDNNKPTLWLEEQSGYNIEVQVFFPDANECATQMFTMVTGDRYNGASEREGGTAYLFKWAR